jgi:hypothetical protein
VDINNKTERFQSSVNEKLEETLKQKSEDAQM